MALLKSCVSNRFESLFGTKPVRICLAPGRVNLIGEHIDYSGFGVLPCAITRYTALAGGISSDSEGKALYIGHCDERDCEGSISFDSVDSVSVDCHHWTNYVLAAYLGLRDFGVVLPRGLRIVIGGDLPRASGLSSSSSVVVGSAMLLSSFRLTRQMISPHMLAEICKKAEWYVGVAGGGMDQAAILLSQPGYASWITFSPSLRSVPVKLPPDLVVIVANSLSSCAKAEGAHTRYNLRVFECKLACCLLRCERGRTNEDKPETFFLEDTLGAVLADYPNIENELDVHSRDDVHARYTKNELVSVLGQECIDLLLTGRWGREVWDLNDFFYPILRAKHVFSEATRVAQFVRKCEALCTTCLGSDVSSGSTALGSLMNESGRSCDEDYDCSCPELRRLVSCMQQAGCLGARLTGAGWGGCAVGLVLKSSADKVLDTIRKLYYTSGAGDDVLFSVEPAGGACLYNC